MTEEIKEEIEDQQEEQEGTEEQEEQEQAEEQKEKEEAVKEPEKFVLPEEKAPDEIDDKDTIEIVHNGQVHKVTKEKMVELAQKGFDYDTKVGPHGKLAQMINSDSELSNVVDDYWKKKVDGDKPDAATDLQIKPLDEFDSEEDWLKDNLKVFAKQQEALQPKQPTPQPSVRSAADALQMRDPEFFDRIYPQLDKYAEDLSVKDYKRVDTDMGALYKFYDYVKEQETQSSQAVGKRVAPSFRAKSGGGEAPKSRDIAPAWKMSKADFQKQLDKIKGYG